MATTSQNITQITPAAARAIADTVRRVRAVPQDRRAVANPGNSVFIASLPPGGFKFQVLAKIDDGPAPSLAGGQVGWRWVQAHSYS